MHGEEKIIPYYTELRTKLAENFKPEEILEIDKAYDIAKKAHDEQMRKSGEPYIIHPLAVANILLDLGIYEKECIQAALLHDVVEDTILTLEELKEKFGEEVEMLVDGVTKLGRYEFSSSEEQEAENIRKMFIAMSKDVRIIVIKLADRLHNMRTLKFQTEEKQRIKAKETLDIYAPIAHRLGIRPIKEELEDLAIRTLDPVAYREISEKLDEQSVKGTEFLNKIKDRIYEAVFPDCNEVRVEGRIKSVHGIYRKMYMQNKSFEQIYDIYAVRIIVQTLRECWNALGCVHDLFTPVNERFKDYTSNPKANGYQSIHTTVVGSDGIKFEVQIRTEEMHRTAEYGIAAHWKYKSGQRSGKFSQKFNDWARQTADILQDTDDRNEVLSSIRSDIAPEEVYAVTPKGKAIGLPQGSTVIDFAYAVHTDVGNKMVGAKVDGRIVQINYILKNGEVVEILTSSSPDKGPSRDWLNIVRTSSAKQKIRNWFKRERREENIIEGKARIGSEMRRNSMTFLTEEIKNTFMLGIAEKYDCTTLDDFYAKIGYGGIILTKAVNRINDEYNKQFKKPDTGSKEPVFAVTPKQSSRNSVIVDGIENCLYKLSRCCNPIPGDNIIGYITRGFGVSIHKRDCSNVPVSIEDANEPERWRKAHWGNISLGEDFTSSIVVRCVDRMGILADVTTLLAQMHVMVHGLHTVGRGDDYDIVINLTVNSVEHLKYVMKKLGDVHGVIMVSRASA
jgi:GTP pyrophosphokinase